jgi:hypothetical protein
MDVILLTGDRLDLSSERALHGDSTVTVKRERIPGHESERGLDTKTD